jgi:hypothetical protein
MISGSNSLKIHEKKFCFFIVIIIPASRAGIITGKVTENYHQWLSHNNAECNV